MTPRFRTLFGAAIASAALMVWAPAAVAQDVASPGTVNPDDPADISPNFDTDFKKKPVPRRIKVTIDFRQAPLEEVVKFFSSLMNENYIISNSLQANKNITIISPKPVSKTQAYRAFLMALQMNGLTIVKAGAFKKIVESKKAIQEPLRIIEPNQSIPDDANIYTARIPVENSDIDGVQKVIQSYLTPDATMIVYGTNLLITENGSNLRRMRRIVRQLDQSGTANQVFVVRVQHAEATEIEAKLGEIFSVEGAASNNARTTNRRRTNTNNKSTTTTVDNAGGDELDVDISEIIADERTNQLIIVTDPKSFGRIRQMIELLDVPTEVGGQIHVKFLEYANAEELAATLSSLATGVTSANQRRPTGTTSSPGNRSSASRGSSGPTTAQLLQGEVQITAYAPTNALLITASPRDYVALERVVSLLDRPRKQVYVEAVIMEISLDVQRSLDVGLNGGAAQDFEGVIPQSAIDDGLVTNTNGLILGNANFGDGISGLLGGTGGALGLIGPSLVIPGIELTIPAFALFLQSTQTDNNINVLSTPSLLTLDNEEAEIVVGDQVPFPQGGFAGGGGGLAGLGGLLGAGAGQNAGGLNAGNALGLLGGGLFNQVQYEDVGITLRIKPQVNQSKYVRLEVTQQVSSVGAPTEFGPTRSNRTITTIVLVKDQSTVVIGGLIRDDENETETKVPFFGDIPLIGVLFRNSNITKTKQNLVLMLTPYIIESEADLQKIYERKREERQELLKLFRKRDRDYMARVNYDKKSGLLDRMRTTLTSSLQEEKARQDALEAFEDQGPRYRILGTPAPSGEIPKTGEGQGGERGGSDTGGSESGGESTGDKSE